MMTMTMIMMEMMTMMTMTMMTCVRSSPPTIPLMNLCFLANDVTQATSSGQLGWKIGDQDSRSMVVMEDGSNDTLKR